MSDPRASEKLQSGHLKPAEIEVAVAIAKGLLPGIRISDAPYRAEVALAEWRRALTDRGR